MKRKTIAEDTVRVLEQGSYTSPSGKEVSLKEPMQPCLAGTRCYQPEELAEIQQQILAQPPAYAETKFEVVNETTLQATARMVTTGAYSRVGVLNFASAKNPGGGFLGGAQAQEESLARSSGLYKSLLQCWEYYAFHRSHSSCLYSDRIIYSPACPVFRLDNGTLLEKPYLADFLTSPAPNAGAIRRNEPENIRHIALTLEERSRKILSLAVHQECEALVLGAWGCGVFQNDPATVAQVFSDHLGEGTSFWGRFRSVVFAVLDNSSTQATIAAFQKHFGHN